MVNRGRLSLLLVIAGVVLGSTAVANNGEFDVRQVPEELIGDGEAPRTQGHLGIEIGLSIGVLVFGAIIMLAEICLMIKQNKYWDSWSLKILGLTLVLVSGLFLIVAGYSQDQTAPMMGLLGTVAGYLLGSEGKDDHRQVASTKQAEK